MKNKVKQIQSVLDQLEPRRLMAGVPLSSSVIAYGVGQQLRINGTINSDAITLTQSGSTYTLTTSTGYSQSFDGNYNTVRINGGRGNDQITIDSSVTTPTMLFGDDGNDTLNGGAGDDQLFGGAGNDSMSGNGGRDTLIGIGGGRDVISGGAGNDIIWADLSTLDTVNEPTGDTINRVNVFETNRFITGTTRTQAISKELTAQRFRDPNVSNKAYVYKRFDNRPLFANGGPSADDVNQGQIGNCYFLATIAGAAAVTPQTIRTMMSDLGDGTYAVKFKTSSGADKYYRVDNDLPTFSAASSSLAYAKFGNEGSTWVAIAEKAYAFHRQLKGTYASMNGGWMGEVFTALGQNQQQSAWNDDFSNASDFINWVEQQLNGGKTVTLGITNYSGPLNLVNGHAYTVTRVQTNSDGSKQLVIRNPWGLDGYRSEDGRNDGYVTLTAAQAHAAIDCFVSGKAA